MIPKDTRDHSRARLLEAFMFSLGTYTEQESKKLDDWAYQNLGQIFAHTAHEMEEIRNNIKRKMPMTYLVHNCADLLSLSCILMAHVMKEAGCSTMNFDEEQLNKEYEKLCERRKNKL